MSLLGRSAMFQISTKVGLRLWSIQRALSQRENPTFPWLKRSRWITMARDMFPESPAENHSSHPLTSTLWFSIKHQRMNSFLLYRSNFVLFAVCWHSKTCCLSCVKRPLACLSVLELLRLDTNRFALCRWSTSLNLSQLANNNSVYLPPLLPL